MTEYKNYPNFDWDLKKIAEYLNNYKSCEERIQYLDYLFMRSDQDFAWEKGFLGEERIYEEYMFRRNRPNVENYILIYEYLFKERDKSQYVIDQGKKENSIAVEPRKAHTEKNVETPNDLISKKWVKIIWYGDTENLINVFTWCLENKYLDDDFKNNMKLWLNTCFIYSGDKKIVPKEKVEYKKKIVWHGTISSLVYFLKVLVEKAEFIRDIESRNEWINDHFKCKPVNKKQVEINTKSLSQIWSSPSIKNRADFDSLLKILGK